MHTDDMIALSVCVDCIIAVANGEYPDDTEHANDIVNAEQGWANRGYHLVPGDDDDTFSWRHCELCQTTLGGSRHSMTAMTRTPITRGEHS
jgi:hypothetical protein